MSTVRHVILIGMKSSGKTTAGRVVSNRLHIPFVDLDAEIERIHQLRTHQQLRFRDIFRIHGSEYFKAIEAAALCELGDSPGDFLLAAGGSTPINHPDLLPTLGTVVFLDIDEKILLPRILAGGIPPFFPYPDDPEKSLHVLLSSRRPVYAGMANATIVIHSEPPDVVADRVIEALSK
jgi:shikimate kinase